MKRITGLVAIVMVLAACGGGGNKPAVAINTDSSSATTTTEATTTTAKNDAQVNAAKYVKDVVSDKASDYEEAVGLSAPGSPAHAYAVVQLAQTKALIQAGRDRTPGTTKVQDDGSIKVCFSSLGSPEQCITFADFEAGTDGLLTNMTVEGKPLAGRSIEGNGQSVDAGGGTATLIGAVELNTDDELLVAIETKAGSEKLSVQSYSASYVGPDGAQLQADGANTVSPSTDIQPGASVIHLLFFQTGKVGGTVTLRMCPPSFQCSDAQLTVA